MTVQVSIAQTSLNWSGVETVFAAGFPAMRKEDVRVEYVKNDASSPLVRGTHYNVTLAADSRMVTVTPIALPAAPATLRISRNSEFTQEDVFVESEAIPAATHEWQHDHHVMRLQELRRDVDGLTNGSSGGLTLFPPSAQRRNAYFFWDSSGNPIGVANPITVNTVAGLAFDTLALAQAATIISPPATLRLNGYYAAGDAGSARYKKVGSIPVHGCYFQSADGAIWELDERVVTPEQCGARGAGDDTTAVFNFVTYCAKAKAFGVLRAVYTVGPLDFNALSFVTIHGLARKAFGFRARDPNQAYIWQINYQCAGWRLVNVRFDGLGTPSARPTWLVICDGVEIDIDYAWFDTAVNGLWLRRGGYSEIANIEVASCTGSYIKFGGLGAAAQYSESTIRNVICDARFGINVTEANYASVVPSATGVAFEFDSGASFLRMHTLTAAGQKKGVWIHNSIDSNAWPSLSNRPSGLYFYSNMNFDWIGEEALLIENAGHIEIYDAYLRSLLSYAVAVANCANFYTHSLQAYSSHLGGVKISGNFNIMKFVDPELSGNNWPSASPDAGAELYLYDDGTSPAQGVIRINGGQISCYVAPNYIPAVGSTKRAKWGILRDAGFTAELHIHDCMFRGHAIETQGVLGVANNLVETCPGLDIRTSGTVSGTTDGSGRLLIPHGLKHGATALTPASALAQINFVVGKAAVVTNRDATNLEVTIIDTMTDNAVPGVACTVGWSARAY